MIIDELFEAPQMCPECGGISFSDLILAEKKDACYYKVKASAKVWPSAYASGRLVQCRKKGAANYANKSESVAEDQLDEKWSQKYKSSINCANPKGFSQKAHCAGRKKNEDVEESLGKQIHSTFQSMGDSFSDAHLAKGISYFLQGRHQEGENWLRGKIPQAAQDAVFGKLRTLQAQGGVDVNKNANVQQYIDDKLVPWVKNQIQQHVKEGEQQKGADYRDPKEVDYDDDYNAMVARVKKLAGLGPMKTVYDPNRRVYRNMPTAVQPKK